MHHREQREHLDLRIVRWERQRDRLVERDVDRFAVQVVHLDQLLVGHEHRARLRVALHLRRLVAHGHARVGAETHREAFAHCHRLQLCLQRCNTQIGTVEGEGYIGGQLDTADAGRLRPQMRSPANTRSVSTRQVQSTFERNVLSMYSAAEPASSGSGLVFVAVTVRNAHGAKRGAHSYEKWSAAEGAAADAALLALGVAGTAASGCEEKSRMAIASRCGWPFPRIVAGRTTSKRAEIVCIGAAAAACPLPRRPSDASDSSDTSRTIAAICIDHIGMYTLNVFYLSLITKFSQQLKASKRYNCNGREWKIRTIEGN